MIEWNDKSEYIQIVDCGEFGYSVQGFPHTREDDSTHDNDLDKILREAFANGYRPVCSYQNNLIMRNDNL